MIFIVLCFLVFAVTSVALSIFVGIFHPPIDLNFLVGCLTIFVGNTLIAILTQAAHKMADTGVEIETHWTADWFRRILKWCAGVVEIFFYTALLLFAQFTLLARWLVIKAIGTNRIWSDPRIIYANTYLLGPSPDNLARKEGASVAIARMGTIAGIVVAVFATISFHHSRIASLNIYRELISILQPNK